MNNEWLATFVLADNGSSSIKTAIHKLYRNPFINRTIYLHVAIFERVRISQKYFLEKARGRNSTNAGIAVQQRRKKIVFYSLLENYSLARSYCFVSFQFIKFACKAVICDCCVVKNKNICKEGVQIHCLNS